MPDSVSAKHNAGFTLLLREAGWESLDTLQLTFELNCPVFVDQDYPNAIVLKGQHSKEELVPIIGETAFNHKLVDHLNEHELPFRPGHKFPIFEAAR